MRRTKAPLRATPSRAAPSVPVNQGSKVMPQRQGNYEKVSKIPPPRPPPPKFDKMKKRSPMPSEDPPLIDLSSPEFPQDFSVNNNFGGSISSSFSNSTSSLASSKKSFELDSSMFDTWSLQSNSVTQSPVWSQPSPAFKSSMPTIIRAQPNKSSTTSFVKSISNGKESPPMPLIPPPSPPRETEEVDTPYAIALYNYPAPYQGDLELQVDDIVVLLEKVDENWYYGRVGDREGIFPANFVDVQVPLKDKYVATALYEFVPELPEDLALYPGKKVTILGRINDAWLFGESSGQVGQFPSSFVDKVPSDI